MSSLKSELLVVGYIRGNGLKYNLIISEDLFIVVLLFFQQKYPMLIKDANYDMTGIEIEIMDKQCLLLRHALNINEQITLFQDIESKDKSPTKAPKAMYPSPKTLVFDQNKVSLKYKSDQNSAYNQLVNKANDIINRNHLNINFDVELNILSN